MLVRYLAKIERCLEDAGHDVCEVFIDCVFVPVVFHGTIDHLWQKNRFKQRAEQAFKHNVRDEDTPPRLERPLQLPRPHKEVNAGQRCERHSHDKYSVAAWMVAEPPTQGHQDGEDPSEHSHEQTRRLDTPLKLLDAPRRELDVPPPPLGHVSKSGERYDPDIRFAKGNLDRRFVAPQFPTACICAVRTVLGSACADDRVSLCNDWKTSGKIQRLVQWSLHRETTASHQGLL